MSYLKQDSRYERVELRTTGVIKKALAAIAKHDHRTMTNEIEFLILKRSEELKKGENQ